VKPITIVGGGLGGLTTGIYLRKLGVPVSLYEAGNYPKHKVCGEFICGVSSEILREMGVENIINDSLHHRKMSWWMGTRKMMSAEMPTVAWGLSRYKLDLDLSKKFTDLGGVLNLGQRIPLDDINAPGLVLGVGKKKNAGNDWIGLKMHVTNLSVKGLEMHVGNAGYVGLCEVEGGVVNVCGLFKVQKGLRGKDLLLQYLNANGLEKLVTRLKSTIVVNGSPSATAGFSLGVQPYEGGFRTGDAAYLIPPFTGNGMSMALESAYIGGEFLHSYANETINWQQACALHRDALEKHFYKRMKWATMLHPFFFSKLGQTALKLGGPLLPYQFLFERLRSV